MKQITRHEEYKELAKALGTSTLFFKREDLHPLGSHKGRSMTFMIDHYLGIGSKKFVISSSGNAAIASARYINGLGRDDIELIVYVGNKIDSNKFEQLRELETDIVKIFRKERPKQALNLAVEEGYTSLRQSTDDIALIGYKSLAEEIISIGDITSVFLGASSGTTAQALASEFIKRKLPIQIHIVQTSSCHPLIEDLGAFEFTDEESIAGAIVDIVALRKEALVPLIDKTHGRGWYATNEKIRFAIDKTKEYTNLDISTNSALSVVGLIDAIYDGYDFGNKPLCLICGQ